MRGESGRSPGVVGHVRSGAPDRGDPPGLGLSLPGSAAAGCHQRGGAGAREHRRAPPGARFRCHRCDSRRRALRGGGAPAVALISLAMGTVISASAIDRFRAIVGPGRVLATSLERLIYAKDGSMNQGDCGLAVLCETTGEVAACVKLAAEFDLPIVPRGSGTSLAGSAIPLDGSVVISLARMGRIISVDPDTPCAWVAPGVLNLDLTAAVTHLGLHYAPDPSSQAACSIGGNVATNAGGPHCLASGVTAQHILG